MHLETVPVVRGLREEQSEARARFPKGRDAWLGPCCLARRARWTREMHSAARTKRKPASLARRASARSLEQEEGERDEERATQARASGRCPEEQQSARVAAGAVLNSIGPTRERERELACSAVRLVRPARLRPAPARATCSRAQPSSSAGHLSSPTDWASATAPHSPSSPPSPSSSLASATSTDRPRQQQLARGRQQYSESCSSHQSRSWSRQLPSGECGGRPKWACGR